MPAAFCGPFPTWERGHQNKRPGASRLDLIGAWVKNLTRLKTSDWEKLRYHHFSTSDVELLLQIGTNAGCTSQERSIITHMIEEYNCAVKEIEELKLLGGQMLKTNEDLAGMKSRILAEIENAKKENYIAEERIAFQKNELSDLKKEHAKKCQEILDLQASIRILADEHQTADDDIDVLEDVQRQFLDAAAPERFRDFTTNLMSDPVIAEDGFTYDRKNIHHWFVVLNKQTSPTTGAHLTSKKLTPNLSLRSQINEWIERRLKGCSSASGSAAAVAGAADAGGAGGSAVVAADAAVAGGSAVVAADAAVAGSAVVGARSSAVVGAAVVGAAVVGAAVAGSTVVGSTVVGARSSASDVGARNSASDVGARNSASDVGARNSASDVGARNSASDVGARNSAAVVGARSGAAVVGARSGAAVVGARSGAAVVVRNGAAVVVRSGARSRAGHKDGCTIF
jgi:hypothetical protein